MIGSTRALYSRECTISDTKEQELIHGAHALYFFSRLIRLSNIIKYRAVPCRAFFSSRNGALKKSLSKKNHQKLLQFFLRHLFEKTFFKDNLQHLVRNARNMEPGLQALKVRKQELSIFELISIASSIPKP